MVQINTMTAQQRAHVLEGGFFAIDVVVGGIVFASSSWNIELAAGDDFEVISFLELECGGRGRAIRAALAF